MDSSSISSAEDDEDFHYHNNTTSRPSTTRPIQFSHTYDHHDDHDHNGIHRTTPSNPTTYLQELYPGQSRSLFSISLRAYLLGISSSSFLWLTIYILLTSESPIWRAPCFLCVLSLFHFLEFSVTALRNTRQANVAAFLLSSNGAAYNAAHASALLECVVTAIYRPQWQIRVSQVWLGVMMVMVGQAVRSLAMLHAGTNFNHIVQWRKAQEHRLVTTGVYKWFRHPSYFGFFWWALGTQVVCGNVVCCALYAVVLWRFFSTRVRKEEEYLVEFFREDYEVYRKRTKTWLPFIG